jgi:anti-sigma B factor antagonist
VDLVITTDQVVGRSIVAVEGEVDIATAGELDAALSAEIAGGRHDLVVDLSQVSFLDSTGLGVLIKALKRTREADGSLAVVTDSQRVLKVFRITGLDSVVPLFPTLEAALAAQADTLGD